MNRTEMDYYAVLNVSRAATKEEITLAYRNLAIRLCPFRDAQHKRDFIPLADPEELTHMKPLPLQLQWEYINMAFDVLGNEFRRSVYDRYGEAGLFEGVLLPNGFFSPYMYDGDDMRVYNSVFGSYSPYANIVDAITNPPILYSSCEHGIGVRTKDPPVEKTLYLTLEEVREGCVKLMHVWRLEICDNETGSQKKKKTLTLHIKPGTTPGTRYTFREEGDQHPTRIPADIVFITVDKPHPSYKRVNLHDLVCTYEISLSEALTGFRFTLNSLDNRKLIISITDVVSPSFKKIIPGEGLPHCIADDPLEMVNKPPKQYGDLIIKFEIKFPQRLSPEMKLLTREFFGQLHQMEHDMLCKEKKLAQLALGYK